MSGNVLELDVPLAHGMATTLATASAVVLLLSVLLLLLRSKGSSTKLGGKGSAIEVTAGAGQEKAVDNRPRCQLLFGTQTGTAERFAKDLRMQLTQRYGDSMVFETADLEDYAAQERLPSEKLVFLLVATYGDGEPTDNAAKFYDWMMQMAGEAEGVGATPLEGVHYGVFGLGNKQYEHFCAVGKYIHSTMANLGATPVVRRGDGDDDEDLDADFESWCTELFDGLDKGQLVKKQEDVQHGVCAADLPAYQVRMLPAGAREAQPPPAGSGLDHNSTFPARVAAVRELHSSGSGRSCVHVELDVSGSSIRYEAGDHVAVAAPNSAAVVQRAASLLGADLDAVLKLELPPGNPGQLAPPFPGPVSLRTALSRHVDLSGPVHKQQLAALAAFASDKEQAERLRRLAAPEGRDDFHAYCVEGQRCLLDVMQDFPSARPPLGVFFGSVASRLQPRFYSISSSPLAHPGQVHITCAVVSEKTPTGRLHEGVASTWLAQLRAGDMVDVFVRSSSFKMPADRSAPIVMVGPGTGLAPFRGFLQERQALAEQGVALGPAYLYFGCRTRQHDFIYQEELQAWAGQPGVLTRLHCAFSREGPIKDYVQHHMLQTADELWEALGPKGGGYLYVCGDAKHMARDVHRTLHEVAQRAGGCPGHQAESVIKELADGGRYHKDVW